MGIQVYSILKGIFEVTQYNTGTDNTLLCVWLLIPQQQFQQISQAVGILDKDTFEPLDV